MIREECINSFHHRRTSQGTQMFLVNVYALLYFTRITSSVALLDITTLSNIKTFLAGMFVCDVRLNRMHRCTSRIIVFIKNKSSILLAWFQTQNEVNKWNKVAKRLIIRLLHFLKIYLCIRDTRCSPCTASGFLLQTIATLLSSH